MVVGSVLQGRKWKDEEKGRCPTEGDGGCGNSILCSLLCWPVLPTTATVACSERLESSSLRKACDPHSLSHGKRSGVF